MRPDFNKMELIPAIVQDYQTKQVLMLAYVNEEAYDKMLETNLTYFYSRSRKGLWHKGETSGHIQHIKGMYLDCDLDTILIFVDQIGVACHTGAYSCFFEEVKPFDGSDIFVEIEKMIIERKETPVPKSYTNYLLEQGIDKVCKKIGEEASETIIAAKNNDKEELVGEIGDLLYHVMVLMNQQDISLEDVQNILKQRHQITGNKKVFHTKGEY
ncbi:bifunctional phosphoribosyl-AMP cyclohydrolase/phosphoribosyl-ATP diphosphatase HisIE [Tannockella kyphosi]|uniref:bifunctional phosphoribosyl-AMP cyclohydrolase/phosphoribosyl-ATP diphosphatase HisIE n=1 Tax=Tannockella kyphosi TaxID=2899121 RepID=UPI0020133A63|nr:bifunctional phosphoribosyl-AMP cyclohydrolase/phosphoribosyl-ATP diphosphatase HisIE [Tannockella kyphosi]